jgi:hypothetical protein
MTGAQRTERIADLHGASAWFNKTGAEPARTLDWPRKIWGRREGVKATRKSVVGQFGL